jgi:hypothetical protein
VDSHLFTPFMLGCTLLLCFPALSGSSQGLCGLSILWSNVTLQEYFKDVPTVSLASVTVSVVSVTNKSTQEHFGVPDGVSYVSLPDRLWRRSAQREASTCATQRDRQLSLHSDRPI